MRCEWDALNKIDAAKTIVWMRLLVWKREARLPVACSNLRKFVKPAIQQQERFSVSVKASQFREFALQTQ